MAIISNAVTIADAGAFSVSLGSKVHIKTLTASSSATLSFVHGTDGVVLDSTYPIYKFEFINCHPATNGVHLEFQGSINTGSGYGVTATTTLFRAYHNENGSSSAVTYGNTSHDLAQSTDFIAFSDGNALGNGNDECISGSLTLYNPSSTVFVKHFTSDFNEYHVSDLSINGFVAGYFNTTSALNAFQFKMSSGNFDGKIKLYGIKDS